MDDKKEGNKNYLISHSEMDKRRDDEKMEVGWKTPLTGCRFENSPRKAFLCLIPDYSAKWNVVKYKQGRFGPRCRGGKTGGENVNRAVNMEDKKEGNKNYLISYSGMDKRRDDEKMEAGTTTPPTGCRSENYRTFLFASVHWEEPSPPT
ncbi:hypothetical protein CDAR_250461 [Caerostris darwini]|uniref:Uncharacterized protein n=1 Tax=Caerostris darwini TaxID=1538125 RepID=A0AAV4UE57_9ARAC|nr:hypothetical protein CDAR_250461 [Caerostris darwini]